MFDAVERMTATINRTPVLSANFIPLIIRGVARGFKTQVTPLM